MNARRKGVIVNARRYGWSGLVCCVLVGFVAPDGVAREPTEQSTEVPRYRFIVGQEISYQAVSEISFGDRSIVSKTDWTIAVVKRNGDGSWRLILSRAHSFNGNPSRALVGYCDLFPDGRIPHNSTLGWSLYPCEVLVRLPDNEESLHQGWRESYGAGGLVHKDYRWDQSSGESNTFLIAVEHAGKAYEVGEITLQSVIQFDRAKGLVAEVQSKRTQGVGNGKGTAVVELKSIEMHPADWCDELLAEAEVFFQAADSYDELRTTAERNLRNTDEILSEALNVLNVAREGIHASLFLDQLDEKIRRHAQEADRCKRLAQTRAEVVGQPPLVWEATDFDGHTHSLEQYRGKVVILDFWTRNCGWCVLAMPQVKQVADHFSGEPVVVLGMNTDSADDDALFMIDKMELNYPSLKAIDIAEKYQVRAFPKLLIIDQEGRVHDIHNGYSPTLSKDVTAVVKNLLAKG